MELYKKKPVVVEAVQFTIEPWTASDIIQWILDNNSSATFFGEGELIDPGSHIMINTLEGRMIASEGDWIIKGVKGEFYPCKPDIFEETYGPDEKTNVQEDNKYGRVSTQFGDFEDGEPVFIFRAKDKHLLEVLEHYEALCFDGGSLAPHLISIKEAHKKIADWQNEHGTKNPGMTS